jgi:hypothetical protein
MTLCTHRSLTLPLALAGAACAKQVPAPVAPVREAPLAAVVTHAEFQAAAPVAPSCAEMGPFRCALPPSSDAELCAQLASCLAQTDGTKAQLHVTGCGELSEFESAPAESGIGRVAVVNVEGEIDGVSGQGSYLVAESTDGFCLVDQALRWESLPEGYVDTDARLDWHREGEHTRLSVRTQALRFDESEDEGAAIRGAQCRDAEYALHAGRFVTLREQALDAPCSDED